MTKRFALTTTLDLTPFPLSAKRLIHVDGVGRRGGEATKGGGGPWAPRLLQNLTPPPA
jgi:hypothetical protein